MTVNTPKVIFVIPDMLYLYNYKEQFSLGILYLSTVLKEEGCEVEIYDTNAYLIEEIPKADIYGFSAVHTTYESCVALAKKVEQKFPLSVKIVGGVYITLSSFADIDGIFEVIFTGEAEDTIRQFIKTFKEGKAYFNPYHKPGKEVDIDRLVPDRSLLSDDYIRTDSIFTDGKTYDDNGCTSIMFSRGCPYNCHFCASSRIYNRRIRFRPIPAIVEEVQSVIDTYSIRQFRVQDDTFTVNKDYFIELAKALEPLGIFYRCSTRANHITRNVAEWLYKSGCREVGIGVEVADDKILKQLNKKETVEQMEKAISYLRAFPIDIRCFFILGLPFDSYETVYANIDFIERNKVEKVMTSNFIPFPGTEMYQHPDRFNIKSIKTNEFTCLNFASHIPLSPNILREDMSEKEHTKIMKVFYDYMMEKGFIH